MGFFQPKNKRKSKKSKSQKKQSSPAALTFSTSNDSSDRRAVPSQQHHLSVAAYCATNILESNSPILRGIKVVATENVEVMTAESQQALLLQREAIRKQLFDDTAAAADRPASTSAPVVLTDTSLEAMNTSHEVLANGRVVPNFSSATVLARAAAESSPQRMRSMPLPQTTISPSYSEEDDDNRSARYDDDDDNDQFTSILQSTNSTSASRRQKLQVAPSTTTTSKSEDRSAKTLNTNSARHTFSPQNLRNTVTRSLPKSTLHRDYTSPLKQEQQQQTTLPVASPRSASSRPMDERLLDRQSAAAAAMTAVHLPFQSSPHTPADEHAEFHRDELQQQQQPRLISFSESEDDDNDELHSASATQDTSTSFVSQKTTATTTAIGAALAAAANCGALTACATGDRSGAAHSNNNYASGDLDPNDSRRPVYLNEAATRKFLKRILHTGFVVLYLMTDDDETFAGRTVTLTIGPGEASRPARLEWTTVAGGRTVQSSTQSVALLELLAVDRADNDESAIFTVTTATGAVHLWEATSLAERDRIVDGLRTVLARWSFGLVAGDCTATAELYPTSSDATGNGARHHTSTAAATATPMDTMHQLAHQLLEE